MKRPLVVGITVVFGIVPATYLVLHAFVLVVVALSTPLADSEARAVPWLVAASLAAGTAGVVGYCALLFVVKGELTRRVVVGLLVGIAANISGIVIAWEANSSGWKRDWLAFAYLFGSPIMVAALHLVAHFLGGRSEGNNVSTRAA